jgi:hypothetical protein
MLNKKTSEYAEWWIFKPESPLAKFIERKQLSLNLYFRPIELTSLIEQVANQDNLYERGNYDVMFLSQELQQCFHTTYVYRPYLYNLCLPHVNIVNESKSSLLKHDLIQEEIFINTPHDIIFSDPSSKFWIPRQFIHSYTSNDNQHIFTWKDLYSKFSKFVTNPDNSIPQKDPSLFFIKEESTLATLCNFKQFHKNQIHDMLKKITKFLGKSNTILSLCSDLKFSDVGPYDPVVYWIEEVILKNNNLMPYTPSNIYL